MRSGRLVAWSNYVCSFHGRKMPGGSDVSAPLVQNFDGYIPRRPCPSPFEQGLSVAAGTARGLLSIRQVTVLVQKTSRPKPTATRHIQIFTSCLHYYIPISPVRQAQSIKLHQPIPAASTVLPPEVALLALYHRTIRPLDVSQHVSHMITSKCRRRRRCTKGVSG